MSADRHLIVSIEGEGGYSTAGAATTAGGIDAWFDALDAEHVVVHFHGGLVPIEAAIERSATFLAGWGRSDVATIFVAWQTGPGEVSLATLEDLLGRSSIVELARFVEGRLRRGRHGAIGQASVGEADLADLADEARADEALQAALRADDEVRGLLEREGAGELAKARQIGGRSFVGVAASIAAVGVAVLAAVVVSRVRARRNGLAWNGPRATTVEEVARALGLGRVAAEGWQRIRRNAERAYGEGRDAHHLARKLVRRRAEGGRISVVAHSAGSLHAGALLRAMERLQPDGRLIDCLVHVAPACDDAEARDIVRLRRRIGRYRLFALDRATEDAEGLGGPAYGGSLLTLISGLLEEEPGWPVLGMQRFVQDDRRYAPFLAEVDAGSCAVWSPSAHDLPGRRTSWKRHGGFDLDPDTVASIRYWIEAPPDPNDPWSRA